MEAPALACPEESDQLALRQLLELIKGLASIGVLVDESIFLLFNRGHQMIFIQRINCPPTRLLNYIPAMHLNRKPDVTPRKPQHQPHKDTKSASTHKIKPQQPFRTHRADKTALRLPLEQMESRDLFHKNMPKQNSGREVQLKANTFKYRIKQILKEIACNKVQNNHILKNLEFSLLQLREKKQTAFRMLNQRLSEIIEHDQHTLQERIDHLTTNIKGLQNLELEIDFIFEAQHLEQNVVERFEEKVAGMAPTRGWANTQTDTPDLMIIMRQEYDLLSEQCNQAREDLSSKEKELQNYKRLYENEMSLRSMSRINQFDLIEQKNAFEQSKKIFITKEKGLYNCLKETLHCLSKQEYREGLSLEELLQEIKKYTIDRLNFLQQELEKYRDQLHSKISRQLEERNRIQQQAIRDKQTFVEENGKLVSQQNQIIASLEQRLERQDSNLQQIRLQLAVKDEKLKHLTHHHHQGHNPLNIQALLQTVRRDHERTLKAMSEQHSYELQQQNLELQRLRTLEQNANLSRSRENQHTQIPDEGKKRVSYAKYLKEISDRLLIDSPENLVESIKLEESREGRTEYAQARLDSDLPEFDYRVCKRCAKNDLLSPNFCQFNENGRRRIQAVHYYQPGREPKSCGKRMVRKLQGGVDKDVWTGLEYI